MWAAKPMISSAPLDQTRETSREPAVPVDQIWPDNKSLNDTVVLLVIVLAAQIRP